MNKYIIITMSISNVGGAEQFVYNKTKFLEKQGYNVSVFSSLDRDIIIDEFKRFRRNIIPNLMYSPFFFRKSEINLIIKKIIKLADIKSNDIVKIETHSLCAALWGELVAEKLKSQSILLNLQEIHNYSKQEKIFLEHKLNNRELAGITKNSIEQMLGKKCDLSKQIIVEAYCSNVVEDCPDKYSSLLDKNADYSIGSIGRLEKPFVQKMIDTLLDYANSNSNLTFNIVFIGGSGENGVVDSISNRFRSVKNVNLIITGFLYPIPRSLIKNMDLFISTSGSATVSFLEHVPTIKVHPVSSRPTQIMGYTYKDPSSHTMFDEMPNTTLRIQIELALSDIIIDYPPCDNDYYEKMNNEFNKQLLMFSHNNSIYYNSMSVKPHMSLKNMFYFILGRLAGGYLMQRLVEVIRKGALLKWIRTKKSTKST